MYPCPRAPYPTPPQACHRNITAAEAVDREFVYYIEFGSARRGSARLCSDRLGSAPLVPLFSRKVEPPKFDLSKEELANCPAFFQEGLMAGISFDEGRVGKKL